MEIHRRSFLRSVKTVQKHETQAEWDTTVTLVTGDTGENPFP